MDTALIITLLLGVVLTSINFFFWYRLNKMIGKQLKDMGERLDYLERKSKKRKDQIKEVRGDIRLIKALMVLSEEARQKRLKEQQDEFNSDEQDEEDDDDWDDEN